MVEIIGLGTFFMLVWVLASSMATESDAEKRRGPSVLLFCRLVGWWPQEIAGHFIGYEQEIP